MPAKTPKTEAEILAWIRERFGSGGSLRVGPGDDAAVLRPKPGSDLVITTDACLEGRHFDTGTRAKLVGRKLLARSLSDVAAMAAIPTHAVMSMTMRRGAPFRVLRGVFDGIAALAAEFGVALAGGDFSAWDHPMALSLTLLGEMRGVKPVLRSGGRAGDAVFVTGALGGSGLGKHLRFTPRVKFARSLATRFPVHAMIDVSDGFLRDLGNLARASSVAARVDLGAVPVSRAAKTLARRSGKLALEHALSDGEDFELLFALSPADARRFLKSTLSRETARVATLVKGTGVFDAADPDRKPLDESGYDHLLS